MKMILNFFLLVGMSPGSFLPSSITDQLIAPATPRTESKSNQPQKKGADSSPSSPSVHIVPSTYSATRPTGFQFTKGDIRTILTPQHDLVLKDFHLFDLMTTCRSRLLLRVRFMELDHCDTRRTTVTAPEICAHAPPVFS